MLDVRDLEMATKETTSFSKFKEILKTWMLEHSGFSGSGELSAFLREAGQELKERYQDGLSVAGTEVSLLSGL